MLRVAMPSVMLIAALTGCTTLSTATSRNAVCAPWRPIEYSSKHDTAPTVRSVRVHNAVGKRLCGWGAK